LIDESDVKTYKQLSEDLYQIANSIINIKRRSNSLGADQTFSLQEEVFETVLFDSMEKLNNRNRIFITGIRHLNTFLAPGYMSKRLYTYLAFPGGGKSQILLKTALDIRKYNAGVQCKNPENRPAVLMITMENSIEETVERIFNIVASDDDIRNYSPKQVKKMLIKQGGLTLTDKSNIDIIIKYYPNRSIDTNDLYGIIQDLEDEGVEVIALILDYLKRIRPAEKGENEKAELKNITNELKDLAIYWDIPVITAQQLNRTASAIVDAAIQAKKSDVTKLVGRDGVAGAWEINSMVSPYREVC
jgi:replicative DNA helicase